MTASQTTAANPATPISAAVKYSLDFFRFCSDSPRRAENRTEPPIPMRRPRLYSMFQMGLTAANAAVPSGP